MNNVQETKSIEDLTALEALTEIKRLFDLSPNPFQGSKLEVQAQLKGVDVLFEKLHEAVNND
jgi:hypothetical protein